VPKARVTLTGTALIGSKELVTDASGYYRFANLPPGSYTLIVKAEGFETTKQSGIAIETGRSAEHRYRSQGRRYGDDGRGN
jgi:hypothetical protein